MSKSSRSFDQLSIEEVLKLSNATGSAFSSEELEAAIEKLQEWKARAAAREKREQEERERLEAAERARREKEAHDAHVREVTSMDLPLDWENAFHKDARAQDAHADSIPDGLILSLANLGRVDIEYIAAVTGETYKAVIGTLKGSIYQNPVTWGECFYKGWETADEYLTGNLMQKWQIAENANKTYNGYFSDNLKALEKVMPPALSTKEIYVTLGSPWVPADVIDDFILHLFGDPPLDYNDYPGVTPDWYKTVHDEITGSWEIPNKGRYGGRVGVNKTYGTDRIGALYILERTLNMKPVAVTREISCPANASGIKRVIDREDTIAALEKQKKLIDAFQKWVWKDERRKERLEIIYENRYSCVRRRTFDGSFLTFPGMDPSVSLYPYQKNAVARIIFSPNTLLAHEVGAGKTYVMIAAGMEMRRMGLSKKNVYVVPNNIVGQWKSIFEKMYPGADLLCVEPCTFLPKTRQAMMKKIRDEDHDGIIIAYSCFDQIPLSSCEQMEALKEQLRAVAEQAADRSKSTAKLRRRKAQLEKRIAELAIAVIPDDTVFFEELGITRLFVDEAHNYKNVPFETQNNKVLGINSTGSEKCRVMMEKVHLVQKQNDGKGVIFATGTPITNSITDVYLMQRYLQSGELAMLGLQSFDGWTGMFAEPEATFEVDVDTTRYRLATRFSKFHNLPELTSLLSSIADFHRVDASAGIPAFKGYRDDLVAKTPAFAQFLNTLSVRADMIREGLVNRREDNMLLITTDGRKAALDLRLVDNTQPFTFQSKVARCAENVWEIYYNTQKEKSTQIVFCDTSTPKAGFNIYSEMKALLTARGIPDKEIAFVHDALTEKKRMELFDDVRRGAVRILLGSTFKLGLGVNIQDRLIALHHLDVPWRPADMTQREGRILRQGNQNKRVYIYRYITEGSFDAYSWQLLENKQHVISSLLAGSLTERSASDIEDTVLDYAEVKALAIGNPLIKQRVEAANELTRYRLLQRKLVETRMQLEAELMALPGKKQEQQERIRAWQKDENEYTAWLKLNPPAETNKEKEVENETRRLLREEIHRGLQGNEAEVRERELLSYRGFTVLLPAGMSLKKPYLWLRRHGRYYVDLGDSATGNLIRIDNFLAELPNYGKKLATGLADLVKREGEIRDELKKDENYTDQINYFKKKVEDLDLELGVNKA